MPDFEITSPDGRKFVVTAPDGATQEQILAYARQNMPKAETLPQADLKTGRSITDEATRGDIRKPWERALNAPMRTEPNFAERATEYLTGPSRMEKDRQVRQQYEASDEKKQGMSWPAYRLKNSKFSDSVAGDIAMSGIASGRVPELRAPRLAGGAARTTEALRTDALSRARGEVTREDTAAAGAERRAGAAQRAQEEIASRQPHVAEVRAQQRPQASPMHAERQQVLADLREKARALQRSYQEAGMNVGQAQRQVALNERAIQESEQAVSHLEAELLNRPTMSADEFGAKVRQITQAIHDKYSGIRSQQSGFDKALADAGDTPRVNTQPTRALIDQHLKDVRNPQLQSTLETIRDQLETDVPNPANPKASVKAPRLSVRAADSARKYLDGIIRSKMLGQNRLDSETLYIVRQIKKSLVESATQAWQPYRDALAKWRTLSRPLDIVERKGALRKVIDTDPVSTDWALTESEVVGRVISGARAGNPTLTRLITENPGLRDAARLYFTKDLFAREAVPSPASLRTWLKNNERALKQTGLYNEFRDIRVARETAQKAVTEAKDARAGSLAEQRAAEKAERAAAEQLQTAERLRQKQQARIERADKAAESEGTERRVISTRRVEDARQRLARKQAEAQTEGAKRKKVADTYRQFETEIKVARPEQVPTQARGLIKRLRDDGRLTDTQYQDLLTKVQHAEDKITNRAERIKRIKQVVKYAALAAMGYEIGREGVSAVTGR